MSRVRRARIAAAAVALAVLAAPPALPARAADRYAAWECEKTMAMTSEYGGRVFEKFLGWAHYLFDRHHSELHEWITTKVRLAALRKQDAKPQRTYKARMNKDGLIAAAMRLRKVPVEVLSVNIDTLEKRLWRTVQRGSERRTEWAECTPFPLTK